jgi:nickel-dependent lactate racemase
MQLHSAVAGHYIQAHRAGVEIAKGVLGCAVDERADVVVVSSFPADQDFWQSPKGMYSAEYALKGESGGTIILVSPNYEGVGPHPEYPEWMGRDDGDELVHGIFAGKPFSGDALAMAIGNSMSKMRRRRKLVVVSDGVNGGGIGAAADAGITQLRTCSRPWMTHWQAIRAQSWRRSATEPRRFYTIHKRSKGHC